jgi:hypothetical protein
MNGRHNNWGFDWNIESLRRRFWNGQSQAHAAVNLAVQTGRLRPPKDFLCDDCGKTATDYDHRDYGKPLEVDPVCRSCNLRRGRALPKRWSADEAASFARKQVIQSCNWRMATNPDLSVREFKESHIHHWVIARRTALAHWVAARQVFGLRDVAHELFPEDEAMKYEAFASDECLKFYPWMLFKPSSGSVGKDVDRK